MSVAARRIRVVVDGELGPALATAFVPLTARPDHGTTVLEGDTADVDAVLARVTDLGLVLLALETDPPQ